MDTKTLIKALTSLNPLFKEKPRHPTLAGVLLVAKSGGLTLAATNLKESKIETIPCCNNDFQVVVNFQRLKKLVKALAQTGAQFRLESVKGSLNLVGDTFEYSLCPVAEVSEFPFMPIPQALTDEQWEQPQRVTPTSRPTVSIGVVGNYWIDLQTAIADGLYPDNAKPKKAELYATIAGSNDDWQPITRTNNYQQDRRLAVAKGLFASNAKPKKKALYQAIEDFNGEILKHSQAA